MQFFSNWGIARRSAVATALLVFGGTCLLGFGFLHWYQLRTQTQMNENIQKTLQIAQEGFEHSLWNFDDQAAKNLADSFIGTDAHYFLKKITVYNDKNQIFVSRATSEPLSSAYSTISGPIIFKNQTIGHVDLEYSLENEIKAVSHISKIIFFSTIGISFVISLTIFLLLHFLLAIPLKKLIQAINHIEEGSYDLRLKENLPAELGELTRHFNRSVAAIHDRDQKLKLHSLNLEQEVQKRLAELEVQKAASLHSSRLAALGEMSGGIAHEINNPLAVISGKVQIMEGLVKKNASVSEFSRHLEKINALILRMTKIVQNLRTFCRDKRGEKPSRVSTTFIMEAIQDLCSERLKHLGIEFKTSYDPQITHFVCEEISLVQAIINLINNSVDAISKLPSKWIHLRLEKIEQEIVLSVADSGSGISEEIIEKIFQPFFTTKDVGKGTGLGLSVSYGIIKQQGGSLEYDRNSPHTRFVIRLPKGEFMDEQKVFGNT